MCTYVCWCIIDIQYRYIDINTWRFICNVETAEPWSQKGRANVSIPTLMSRMSWSPKAQELEIQLCYLMKRKDGHLKTKRVRIHCSSFWAINGLNNAHSHWGSLFFFFNLICDSSPSHLLKHPHRHVQKWCFTTIWASYNPFKLINKIDHHQRADWIKWQRWEGLSWIGQGTSGTQRKSIQMIVSLSH